MKNIKLFVISIVLAVFAGGVSAYAQSLVKVSGVVTSAEDGLPMMGVGVVAGPGNGVITSLDGDYVIVNRTNYVDNGDIAVVLIGEEATVKTFYRENGVFRLQPENRSMKPIITKDVYILGKVIANIRYY